MMGTVLDDMKIAFRDALSNQAEEVEKRLAVYGLTIGDIPAKCYRVNSNHHPFTSIYYFEDHPIFETKIFFDENTIRAEVNPL